jgi:gag-polypeptide of LTR copia-type
MRNNVPSGAEITQENDPTDTISKVEMRQQLKKIRMKKGTNPALLFEQLRRIEEQFLAPGDKIDEVNLIAIVLNIASDKCQLLFTEVQSVKGSELTLLDLKIVTQQHYREINRA